MLAGVTACGGTDPSGYAAHDPCAALVVSSAAATAVERDGIADALALWRGRGVSAFDQAAPGQAIGAAPTAASEPPGPTPGSMPGPTPEPTIDGAPDAAPAVAAIEIRFDDAGAAFHGIYDPASASVLINRDLVDRTTLAIVIAHELGHVFGLVHIAAAARLSLMNPGNLVTPPTDADQRALEALWGVCAPAGPGQDTRGGLAP
jgi:hypothetical protein